MLIQTSRLRKLSVSAGSYSCYPDSFLSCPSTPGHTWEHLQSVDILDLDLHHLVVYDRFFTFLRNTDNISDLMIHSCTESCGTPKEMVSRKKTVGFRKLINFRYWEGWGCSSNNSLDTLCDQFDFTATSGVVQLFINQAPSQSAALEFPRAMKLEVYSTISPTILGLITVPAITEFRIPINYIDAELLGSNITFPTVTELRLLYPLNEEFDSIIAVRGTSNHNAKHLID